MLPQDCGDGRSDRWQRKRRRTLWVLLRCEPSDVAILYQHEMMGGVGATRIFQLSSREEPVAHMGGQAGETALETEMAVGEDCQSHLCPCQQHLVSA